MSKAIPVRLLPHTATLEHYLGTVNSVPTYAAAVTLFHVRLEPVQQNAMTSLGDMKNDRYLLFFDCVNSLPAGMSFTVKDRITFNGTTVSVRKVTPCYGDSSAIHHYEVNCV